jgi:flagellar biosynthesis/type III secretory pathway M-ring protein FliF/YscJ
MTRQWDVRRPRSKAPLAAAIAGFVAGAVAMLLWTAWQITEGYDR